MDENSDILRLPPKNKKLGSCPECGKPVWDDYKGIKPDTFICIECKTILTKDEIIPF